MKKINENQMRKIKAGGLSAAAIWALVAAGLSFLGGILDGYTRPFKCR